MPTEVAPVTVLAGHDSQETAYPVQDYPFGFRLRCKIRYWLERKVGHGARLMSQTSNPKKGDAWNKPKASTYAPVGAMYLDEKGHVHWATLGMYDDEVKIDAFVATYGVALTDVDKGRVDVLRAYARAQSKMTWRVRSADEPRPVQTLEEQAEIIKRATAIELHKMKGEGK